jgi:glycosyltransferase involved in cell wall biosynthesis
MATLPTITIVTPSYQQAEFLERTMNSVLRQDYPALEYIVLDGGSTDGSVDIIKRYAGRLKYWRSGKDAGQSAAINEGLKMAQGDIVGWLNSDDTLAADALFRIGRFYAENPRTDLVYGNTHLIDAQDRVIRRLVSTKTSAFELAHFNRDIWSQPGTTWRRSLHDKIGYLDESLHLFMDGDWWIRVARQFNITRLPAHLGNLRIHPLTKSTTRLDTAAADDRVLEQRYGTIYRGGLRRRWFDLRRKGRILRDPRNWLYRLGIPV